MGKQKFSDYGMSKNSKNAGSYFSMGRNPKNNGSRNNNYNNNNQRTGRQQNTNRSVTNNANAEVTAPYNFVPLNTRVLKSPLSDEIAQAKTVTEKQNIFENYVQKDGKYSGYFWLDVETLTPLYIESNGVAFSDGKNLCIPGSSMRGAIKNLFKIVTNSTMRSAYKAHNSDVSDKHLYYRSFASAYPDFKQLYIDRVFPEGKGLQTKAGFLVRYKNDYVIYEAEYEAIKTTKVEEEEIKAEVNWAVFGRTDRMGKPVYEPHVVWKDDCVLVYSGPIDGKKHYYKIYKMNWNKKHHVDSRIIEEYKNDKSRNRLNLLIENNRIAAGLPGNRRSKFISMSKMDCKFKSTINYDYIVPCFYVLEEGQVTSFGAGPYFRIAYKNAISDHIPAEINREDIIDYTDAVFGLKEFWSSRVFFEDLYINDETKEKPLLQPAQIKILEGPKPTSFQNYLTPFTNNNNDMKAATWEDTNSQIRGYKMYWHQENNGEEDWKETRNISNAYSHSVSPVKAGNHFKGKIRFENLTETELGALIFVMGLTNDNNPAKSEKELYLTVKLGMGKPIGLGSVAITSSLYLEQNESFARLFGDKNNFCVAKLEKMTEIKRICEAFADAIKQVTNCDIEKTPRIKELKLILDASCRKKMSGKTSYLNPTRRPGKDLINERRILPTITEVKNSLT